MALAATVTLLTMMACPTTCEVDNSLDRRLNDANADVDSDGLSNPTEVEAGTPADNPDTGGDGMLNGDEIETGRQRTVNESAATRVLNDLLSDQRISQVQRPLCTLQQPILDCP